MRSPLSAPTSCLPSSSFTQCWHSAFQFVFSNPHTLVQHHAFLGRPSVGCPARLGSRCVPPFRRSILELTTFLIAAQEVTSLLAQATAGVGSAINYGESAAASVIASPVHDRLHQKHADQIGREQSSVPILSSINNRATSAISGALGGGSSAAASSTSSSSAASVRGPVAGVIVTAITAAFVVLS